jgi:hypothetical protein
MVRIKLEMPSQMVSALLIAITFFLQIPSVTGTYSRHTGIILLGGTGDLARKYLWQAAFDAYVRHGVQKIDDDDMDVEGEDSPEWKFTILAGGHSHPSVAANRLKVCHVWYTLIID